MGSGVSELDPGRHERKMNTAGYQWKGMSTERIVRFRLELEVEEAPDCALLGEIVEKEHLTNHVCVKMNNWCPQKGNPLLMAGVNNNELY